MLTLREQVIEHIEAMDEADLQRVAKYIETIADDKLPPDYDSEKDPLVGFVSGTVDYASRDEEILAEGFGLRKESP
jgi:hypothetical protein